MFHYYSHKLFRFLFFRCSFIGFPLLSFTTMLQRTSHDIYRCTVYTFFVFLKDQYFRYLLCALLLKSACVSYSVKGTPPVLEHEFLTLTVCNFNLYFLNTFVFTHRFLENSVIITIIFFHRYFFSLSSGTRARRALAVGGMVVLYFIAVSNIYISFFLIDICESRFFLHPLGLIVLYNK